MNRWFKILAAVGAVSFIAACGSDDDDHNPPPSTTVSIAETAQSAGLTALVAAADKAGLVPTLSDASQNLTVFAPTDAAFTSLAKTLGFTDAAAMVQALPAADLAKILQYHVVAGRKTAADLIAGGSSQPTLYSFDGSATTLGLDTSTGVKLKDAVLTEASVTSADVAATNGVVHVIDKVLVPPGVLNVVQMAQLNPVFSTLVGAVVDAKLAATLSGPGPFTVFAPTNDAFAAIASTVASLTEASVTSANVAATNGVVHVIDKVLVPPGVLNVVQMAQLNPVFSTLVGAVVDAKLAATLSGPGPFTVFAPTNDAFSAIASTVASLTEAQLVTVLTYHALAGEVLSSGIPFGVPVATVSGQSITINASTPPSITDTTATAAGIVATDIRGSNGVIHVVDKVLIPAL